MITNNGKSIIGKYLLGQAPAYASYLAIGCGPTPLATGAPIGDYSSKQTLDFEMFRVPISSRGFVNENGVDKIVLTAELPTEERYEISEVGIFSAGTNPSAGAYDSKTVMAFTQGENWQRHTATAASAINTYPAALDAPAYDNIIAITDPVFQTNADNPIFFKAPRVARYERPRFLNNVILIRGDEANLGKSGNNLTINSGSNHIHLTGANVDFSKNSPTDELRMALTLINKSGASATVPDNLRVIVDFASTDAESSGEYARFEADLVNGTGIGQHNFTSNRYFIISKQLQDLIITPNFTWNAVTVVKIYVSTLIGGVPSSDYYVALDAIRLENLSTANPLYGLTGYSVIQNADSSTIIKSSNTTNYVEFRFSVGVS